MTEKLPAVYRAELGDTRVNLCKALENLSRAELLADQGDPASIDWAYLVIDQLLGAVRSCSAALRDAAEGRPTLTITNDGEGGAWFHDADPSQADESATDGEP